MKTMITLLLIVGFICLVGASSKSEEIQPNQDLCKPHKWEYVETDKGSRLKCSRCFLMPNT